MNEQLSDKTILIIILSTIILIFVIIFSSVPSKNNFNDQIQWKGDTIISTINANSKTWIKKKYIYCAIYRWILKVSMKSNKIKQLYMPKKQDIIITFYGFMAIVFVLIPEWIAEYGISFDNNQFKNNLPSKNDFDNNRYPLFIYEMNLKELRELALKLKIYGYSSENKRNLSERIHRKIKERSSNDFMF